MTAATARHPARPSRRAPRLASPAAAEMIDMFARRNPETSRAQVALVGKLVAAFGAAATALSPDAQKRLIARKDELRRRIAEIVAEPDIVQLAPAAPAEAMVGQGLGPVSGAAEGAARLAAHAVPVKVEDWAGPVAGATELERDHGIARSTLHAWQKQGAVVALQVGLRKHAFPVEQFEDGRPLAGIGEVLALAEAPRVAWLWLRAPNPGLGGATPLARLKAGAAGRVVEAARATFAPA